MNTDAIWNALAILGNVKIPVAHIYNAMPPGSSMSSIASEILRIQDRLYAEAAEEGVSLQIKPYHGGLGIYLQKFN
jgi:hypothetical protein